MREKEKKIVKRTQKDLRLIRRVHQGEKEDDEVGVILERETPFPALCPRILERERSCSRSR